jgi:ATP-dependent Lhr-like helicase
MHWHIQSCETWFEGRFRHADGTQAEGWPHILENRDTLISAPTGSGKTLAAFLACIDKLVRQAVAGTLTTDAGPATSRRSRRSATTSRKNLDGPLAEILARAREERADVPDIRTAVRTGDTLMPARQRDAPRPPHILVTTPESLFILLTAQRSREMLRSSKRVIVDEIHAVADDKRGAHLALSLDRQDR